MKKARVVGVRLFENGSPFQSNVIRLRNLNHTTGYVTPRRAAPRRRTAGNKRLERAMVH